MSSKRFVRIASVPYVVWMAIFVIIPLLFIVGYAFTNDHGSFSLENFTRLSAYGIVFKNSFLQAGVATLICLLIGYPFAYIMAGESAAVRKFALLLIMLPMWMNFLLRTLAWMTLLEDKGLINQFLGLLGLGPVHMINTDGAVVLGMVYNFLPFMVLPLYSVMAKMDDRVIEAAQDLGAGFWNVFRRVVLPMSVPGIVTGITMVFVPAVSTFVITKLLGGGKKMLIGDVIEMMFAGSGRNYNVGAALSLVLMVLMLLCMALMHLVDKDDEDLGGMMA